MLNPAPPTVLAVPRDANVQRFDALTSGFAAILELPFDKRRLFNVLHSVANQETAGQIYFPFLRGPQDEPRLGFPAITIAAIFCESRFRMNFPLAIPGWLETTNTGSFN